MIAQTDIKWYSKHKNLKGHEMTILSEYLNESSVTELAQKYKVNVSSIKSIITKNGYNLRSPKESRNLQRYNNKRNEKVSYKFDSDQLKDMITLYAEGYGVHFIAKKYYVDAQVIMRVFRDNKVHIRNWDEQQKFKHVTNKVFKDSIIQKYGGWANLQKRQQESLIKKYGVSNVMQVPEHFYNQQLSSKKQKTLIIDGKTFLYQGYEDKCLKYLISIGYSPNDIQIGKGNVPVIKYYYNGRERIYYPDIYIPKDNLIIEVKSKYTMQKEYHQNIAKKEATQKAGYNVDFIVFT